MEALRPSRSTASLVAVLDVSLWFHTHCQCRSPSLRSSSLGRSNTYLDEDEVRAGLGEPHGHGLADAARAAGDDGRVALEGEERRRHWEIVLLLQRSAESGSGRGGFQCATAALGGAGT